MCLLKISIASCIIFKKKAIKINEKSRNIGEILIGREDSYSPRKTVVRIFFLFFFFWPQDARDEPTNESCAVPLKISKFSNPLFTWIETVCASLRSWFWAGSRGNGGDEERSWGQCHISFAGVLWKFVRSILSIQWSVVSIRSRSGGTCILRLSATFFDSHAEASRRQWGLRVIGRASF